MQRKDQQKGDRAESIQSWDHSGTSLNYNLGQASSKVVSIWSRSLQTSLLWISYKGR